MVFDAIFFQIRKHAAAIKKVSSEHETIPPREPGGGTPLFHGIRVVELGTAVAAPTGQHCYA